MNDTNPPIDLLLKGGRVLDAANRQDGIADVAIAEGRILTEPEVPHRGRTSSPHIAGESLSRYTSDMQANMQTERAMDPASITLDQVLALARQLRPVDQARLVARLAPMVERVLEEDESTLPSGPGTSIRGLLRDLGPAPSAEEIDEVRREMWASFGAE